MTEPEGFNIDNESDKKMELESLLDKIFSSQYNHHYMIPGPYGMRILTYADYIASAQPLEMIESFIQERVLPYYANTHTETSFTGMHSSHLREEARNVIKKCVNANDEDVLIFCGSGSTSAVDKMHRLLVEKNKTSGEDIILFHGPFEHHSNVLPWRESNFQVVSIAITKDGLVDLLDLENQLKNYQGKGLLIGSFSAASNVTGIISPIDKITSILHQYGALSFWDYAAGAPYMEINMNPGNTMHKDAIFISTHKFIGGTGTPGILIAKRNLFSNEVPLMPSGGTVHFVTRNKQRYFEDTETREEGGTPGIVESIRAGLVFKLKSEVGVSVIEQREKAAVDYAFSVLLPNPNIFILGNTNCKRLAFIAFRIQNSGRSLHHNFIVALLNDLFGIQSRGGCSCAGPYGHELLELSNDMSDEYIVELATGNVGIKPGWCRLSLNYFTPDYEIKFIVKAIEWIAENGYVLLKEYFFDDRSAVWTNIQSGQLETNTLSDFSIAATLPVRQNLSQKEMNREAVQKSYIDIADDIAAKARLSWNDKPFQSYVYNQLENPLRWYTLAQDVAWPGVE